MTTTTYRAVQVSKPGRLDVVERELTAPPPGKVRIRVEACGVCHSDSATVDGMFPGVTYPRVPGHEAVGRIDALGDGVQGWAVGQRVGVGFLGGPCGHCEHCRGGDLVNCRNQEYTGVHHDGGYAEVVIAKASGLVAVPDDLVPRNTRVADTREAPIHCRRIRVADATGLNPQPHLARTRLRKLALD